MSGLFADFGWIAVAASPRAPIYELLAALEGLAGIGERVLEPHPMPLATAVGVLNCPAAIRRREVAAEVLLIGRVQVFQRRQAPWTRTCGAEA